MLFFAENILRRGNRIDNRSIKQNCRSVPTMMSTYTHLKGIQTPRTIYTNRCQGGEKNPENYQCQPTKISVICYHTINQQGDDDFLGTYFHESCEERCVCGRKTCKDQHVHPLICPKGYVLIDIKTKIYF